MDAASFLHARQDAAVDQRRRKIARREARFTQPAAVLGGAVRPAFRQAEQRGRVERDRQRAVERVVQEHVVDQHLAPRLMLFSAMRKSKNTKVKVN